MNLDKQGKTEWAKAKFEVEFGMDWWTLIKRGFRHRHTAALGHYVYNTGNGRLVKV